MKETSLTPIFRPKPSIWRVLSSVPFSLWLIALALVVGLFGRLPAPMLFQEFSHGFGSPLGDIALILIPSFVMASAISRAQAAVAGGTAALVAPFAGAAMVCPDTAYAALAPMAGSRKLSVALGAYAGFKLLVPAGPAIVAAMLGGLSTRLMVFGAMIFLVCWLIGLAFARRYEPKSADSGLGFGQLTLAVALPLAVLITIIVVGTAASSAGGLPAGLDFLLSPKGALIAAASVSLVLTDAEGRQAALEAGMQRTAPLLLTIGAASALGAILVATLPFTQLARLLVTTGLSIPALFALAALFKLAKGSSMATFAGTGGLAAALLPELGISAEAASLALCAGAFVTIAPNDSFYWLVRKDALADMGSGHATRLLAIAGILQGAAALIMVETFVWLGVL